MESDVKKRAAFFLFAIFLLAAVFSFGQDEVSADMAVSSFQQSPKDQTDEESKTVVPGAADIQQATSIYVFLGWIWLSIGILIFFLRLKIKEVDRLHGLGYFSENKDTPNHHA